MPKPYSLDLRERAVSRVMAGESVRSVAAVLNISVSSVVNGHQQSQVGELLPWNFAGTV